VSKWERVRLAEAFDLQMGKTPSRSNKAYWNDDANKWISIADIGLAEKYIHKTKETISDLAVLESGIKIVPKNTVIMSFKLSLGKTCIVPENMYTNEAIMAFIDKGKYEIDKYYIYHLFRGKDWSAGTNKAVMGVTLNKATISNIEIPLLPLEIQKKIAKTLDTAADLLAMRKKQLAELDNLIKSTFYDMFGDPVINDKGWEIKRMGEVCSKITDGKHGDCEDEAASEYYFVSAKDIENGTIKYDKARQITQADFEDTNKRTKLSAGDIVVVNTGATIGKTAIVTDNDRTYRTTFQKSVGIIRVISTDLSNLYLQYYIIIDRENIYNSASGSAQKNWLLSQMRNYLILVPPLKLQNRFTDIALRIEEQKALVKKAIEETQYLLDSLMSEYFE
jgi:type I restriction enzyme S subunit